MNKFLKLNFWPFIGNTNTSLALNKSVASSIDERLYVSVELEEPSDDERTFPIYSSLDRVSYQIRVYKNESQS